MNLNIYTVTDFRGFYPVGFAAVIIAHDEGEAHELFLRAVIEEGLSLTDMRGKPIEYTLEKLPLLPGCNILVNGDY